MESWLPIVTTSIGSHLGDLIGHCNLLHRRPSWVGWLPTLISFIGGHLGVLVGRCNVFHWRPSWVGWLPTVTSSIGGHLGDLIGHCNPLHRRPSWSAGWPSWPPLAAILECWLPTMTSFPSAAILGGFPTMIPSIGGHLGVLVGRCNVFHWRPSWVGRSP